MADPPPPKPIEINPLQIPIIGTGMRTVFNAGKIYETIDQVCTPDPVISFRAFFANIPMLVWTIVKPSPIDSAQERFGHGHHKRRKRKWGVQDIQINKPSNGKGYLRWASFRMSENLDKIGWYCMLIDATSDFLVNWSSMAYRYSGCQDPTSGYGSTKRDVPIEYFHGPTAFQVAFTQWSFTAGYGANAGNVSKNVAGARIVTGTVNLGTPTKSPPATIARVFMTVDYGHGEQEIEMDMSADNNGNNITAATASRSYDVLEPPATYRLYVQSADTGWIVWDSAYLQISGFTAPSLEPDP